MRDREGIRPGQQGDQRRGRAVAPVDRARERVEVARDHERAADDHRVIRRGRGVGRGGGDAQRDAGLVEVGRACPEPPEPAAPITRPPLMSRNPTAPPKASPVTGVGLLLGGDRPAEDRARRVGVEQVGGPGVVRAERGPGRADQGRWCRCPRPRRRSGRRRRRAGVNVRSSGARRAGQGSSDKPRRRSRRCPAASRSGYWTRPTPPTSRSRSMSRPRVDDRRERGRACRSCRLKR